jgi:uncharacterized protein (DUF58 family)
MKSWWQRFKQGFHVRYSAWLMQGLSRIIFWNNKFKQRLSPLGMGVAAAILLTLVFGANVKLSSIYQLFALLLALLCMALGVVFLKSKFSQPNVEVRRLLPKFATVDEPITYQIQIKNKSQKDFYQLNVGEVSALPKPTLFQFLHEKEPLEDERNWYDRHTGFYRFVWLQDMLRGAIFRTQTITQLQAGKSQTCPMKFTPLRRGYIHFSHIRLRVPEPLALAYSFLTHPVQDSLLVLPKAYRLPQQMISGGKKAYQQGGVSQASHIGHAEEFSRLREYKAGDSPRHIFWPSLARASKPLVKEYQDEYFSRSALLLDNFAGQDKRALFEEAVSVAAGFAMQADNQDMLLDLMFVGEDKQATHQLVGRAIAHAEQMLETLAIVGLVDGQFEDLSQSVLAQSQRLSGCILLLLVWDEARQALVQQLQALSIPMHIFLLLSEHEEAPKADVHVLRLGSIQQDLDSMR